MTNEERDNLRLAHYRLGSCHPANWDRLTWTWFDTAEGKLYRQTLELLVNALPALLADSEALAEAQRKRDQLANAVSFALNNVVSEQAGNVNDPFAYLWAKDWQEFKRLATNQEPTP